MGEEEQGSGSWGLGKVNSGQSHTMIEMGQIWYVITHVWSNDCLNHKELCLCMIRWTGFLTQNGGMNSGMACGSARCRSPDARGHSKSLVGRSCGRRDKGKEIDSQPSSPQSKPRGRRPTIEIIQEAAMAYHENTSEEIQQLIEKWEADINKQVETEMEMATEEWKDLILDPGQTRGRLTQFKRTRFMYWSMKSILRKALEQISMNLVALAQDFSKYRMEFDKLKFQLRK